jgi:transposase
VPAGACTWCATARASSSACTQSCSRTASPVPSRTCSACAARQLLARLGLPEPWQATIEASLRLIDELEHEIGDCEAELRRLGADHRYVPLLRTVPGIGWVLAYTIAAEIGDINRFATPRKLAGYSGLCPRVYQSGERDLRGPLSKQGPRYLRCEPDRV